MNKKILIVISIVLVLGIIGVLIFCCDNNKEIKLKIDCNGKDLSGVYHKGDTFECELLGKKNELTIKKISSDKTELQAKEYGLTPVREGRINLTNQVKDFELVKGTQLKLNLQATDVSASITIDWE